MAWAQIYHVEMWEDVEHWKDQQCYLQPVEGSLLGPSRR